MTVIGARRAAPASWRTALLVTSALAAAALALEPASAAVPPPAPGPAQVVESDAAPVQVTAAGSQRSGAEIYRQFREGLAEPDCAPSEGGALHDRFAHAPLQMATADNDVLPLFGYVVDALRQASLPTEFALIPFVESGYKAGARSPGGPAGLWQMIGVTARAHGIAIVPGYDGRMSPVDSTQAAVRYLKTLHGMFGGDWRLAAMAYNAGENRVLSAMKRGGQVATAARPSELTGLSPITQAYVRKLHALSCLLDRSGDGDTWMRAMDRDVPRLVSQPYGSGAASLANWSTQRQLDGALVGRLNPALRDGGGNKGGSGRRVLAPMSGPVEVPTTAVDAKQTTTAASTSPE